MSVISNINDQIQRSINEVERNYSRGMEFQLGDLNTVRAAQSATNFSTFLTMCRSKLISSGLVMSMGGNGLTQRFRRK